MAIAKATYVNDALKNYRGFLRDVLNDPLGSNRDSSDFFVYIGEPDTVVGSDAHKVPFVIIEYNDGESSAMGPANAQMGGREETISMTLHIVGRHKQEAREILDDIKDNTLPGAEGSGTDPKTGSAYDIEALSDPEFTDPTNRPDAWDDNLHEIAVDLNAVSWFGG